MAGSVGDDEFALRRGEVAVGDVDRDALLAFGFEAVGEECKIDVFVAFFAGGFLDGFQLIFEDRFGIIKKASDESRFAVVD